MCRTRAYRLALVLLWICGLPRYAEYILHFALGLWLVAPACGLGARRATAGTPRMTTGRALMSHRKLRRICALHALPIGGPMHYGVLLQMQYGQRPGASLSKLVEMYTVPLLLLNHDAPLEDRIWVPTLEDSCGLLWFPRV